ncbi:MAG: AAA-like domain-containing protein [Anaerolineales bacterium]|nr:AAA-like domain-containing protein [Anaerolineales bacterium]
MLNPFQLGSTVSVGALVDRSREIRQLVSGITNCGQSAALVGEPRIGKTSLLRYIMSKETQKALYGESAGKLRFQFMDAQTVGGQFDAPKFWELALIPIAELAQQVSDLQAAYRTSRLEKFGNFVLERLFTQLQAAGWRLVLLLDEFDMVLQHPVLNQSEFYGGLRSLASRYESLALVIASRQSLSELNHATQEFSRMGSPYFNFLQEINLGAFKEKDALALLAQGEEYFTKQDIKYLRRVAGGHPFLLQAAALGLWDVYEDEESDAKLRYEETGEFLYHQAKPVLKDSWRLWAPEMKKVFTIVALDNMPLLLGREREYDLNALLKNLPNYTPELRILEARGYMLPDAQLLGGWGIQAEVMLWWLAEELIQALRKGDELGSWLQAEGWDGVLKHGEKEALVKASRKVGGLLKGGVEFLIRAAAEGFAKGMTGV